MIEKLHDALQRAQNAQRAVDAIIGEHEASDEPIGQPRHTETAPNFAAALREAREAAGLSQSRLAARAGYDQFPRQNQENGTISAIKIECAGGAENTPARDLTDWTCQMPQFTKGDPHARVVSTLYPEGSSPAERFMSRVNRDAPGGCWEWTGSTNDRGYGICWYLGFTLAHRFAWYIHHGDIPDGLYICHTCDNRACVNPDHHFLGTQQDNMDDAVAKGRKARGEAVGKARLTESEVREIRRRHEAGASRQELAMVFGIGVSTVAQIITGQTWKHLLEAGHE